MPEPGYSVRVRRLAPSLPARTPQAHVALHMDGDMGQKVKKGKIGIFSFFYSIKSVVPNFASDVTGRFSKRSVIQQYALKVVKHVCLKKLIFTKKLQLFVSKKKLVFLRVKPNFATDATGRFLDFLLFCNVL